MSAHNYAGNYGATGTANPQSVEGTFADQYQGVLRNGAPFENRKSVPFSRITDGLSKTLLLSEVVQGQSVDYTHFDVRGLVWWGDAAGFSAYLGPNSSQPDIADFGSYCFYPFADNPPCVGWTSATLEMFAARSRHPGGVGTAMCDGSVRFVSDEIDLQLWRALSSIHGNETTTAGF
jgi:prepilin-type processing-associated H-X9-DG protein